MGAVNADDHKELGSRFGVRGFPTIKVFSTNKNQPEAYEGARTAEAIAKAGVSGVKTLVNARLGGKSGSSKVCTRPSPIIDRFDLRT